MRYLTMIETIILHFMALAILVQSFQPFRFKLISRQPVIISPDTQIIYAIRKYSTSNKPSNRPYRPLRPGKVNIFTQLKYLINSIQDSIKENLDFLMKLFGRVFGKIRKRNNFQVFSTAADSYISRQQNINNINNKLSASVFSIPYIPKVILNSNVSVTAPGRNLTLDRENTLRILNEITELRELTATAADRARRNYAKSKPHKQVQQSSSSIAAAVIFGKSVDKTLNDTVVALSSSTIPTSTSSISTTSSTIRPQTTNMRTYTTNATTISQTNVLVPPSASINANKAVVDNSKTLPATSINQASDNISSTTSALVIKTSNSTSTAAVNTPSIAATVNIVNTKAVNTPITTSVNTASPLASTASTPVITTPTKSVPVPPIVSTKPKEQYSSPFLPFIPRFNRKQPPVVEEVASMPEATVPINPPIVEDTPPIVEEVAEVVPTNTTTNLADIPNNEKTLLDIEEVVSLGSKLVEMTALTNANVSNIAANISNIMDNSSNNISHNISSGISPNITSISSNISNNIGPNISEDIVPIEQPDSPYYGNWTLTEKRYVNGSKNDVVIVKATIFIGNNNKVTSYESDTTGVEWNVIENTEFLFTTIRSVHLNSDSDSSMPILPIDSFYEGNILGNRIIGAVYSKSLPISYLLPNNSLPASTESFSMENIRVGEFQMVKNE